MMSGFRTVFYSAVIAFLATGAAKSAELPQAPALQSVILDQIRAFQAGDHARAYSHAAPNIKRIFPNVELFTSMVRNGYMPVYNPGAIDFGPSGETPRGPAQSVFVRGPDGVDYEALYFFEETSQGWKINAVQLRKSDTPML